MTLRVDDVDILQVLYEVRVADRESLVPPALNPTIPPVISFLVYRAKESEFGPFALAQLRLTARSGVRPRAYLVSARCDNPALSALLARSWGFRVTPGAIALRRFHDRVDCTVSELRTGGGHRSDHPGRVAGRPGPGDGARRAVPARDASGPPERDGVWVPRIVQVDSEYEFRRADRGRPSLGFFDPSAWGDERLVPDLAVSASFAACDMTIANVRYICNPDIPASEGHGEGLGQVTDAGARSALPILSAGAHRRPDRFADEGLHPAGDDPDWQESAYLAWRDPVSGLGGNHRIGNEPNRRDGQPVVRPLPPGRDALSLQRRRPRTGAAGPGGRRLRCVRWAPAHLPRR